MDNHRNTYVSQVRNDLAMLISAQKREEETLRNIKNMKFSPEILQKKQSDMKASITKRAESIFILEQREQDFISGKLDNEIKQEIKKNTDNFNSPAWLFNIFLPIAAFHNQKLWLKPSDNPLYLFPETSFCKNQPFLFNKFSL